MGSDSPVVVVDAVDLVVDVDGEGHAVQALVTDAAAEAARVVGLAHGVQDLTESHIPRHWSYGSRETRHRPRKDRRKSNQYSKMQGTGDRDR